MIGYDPHANNGIDDKEERVQCRHHDSLGTLVIFNLPPTVYQGLTADVIHTVDALAFLPPTLPYATLEALLSIS